MEPKRIDDSQRILQSRHIFKMFLRVYSTHNQCFIYFLVNVGWLFSCFIACQISLTIIVSNIRCKMYLYNHFKQVHMVAIITF